VDGEIKGLSPGITYTLTPDSVSGELHPRLNGQESGTVARITTIVDTGAIATLYWLLPTQFVHDDETADPIPCSFEPGSVTVRQTGLRMDPNLPTTFQTDQCVMTFEIGVTVRIPPGASPGSYSAQIISYMVYNGNAKAPLRRPMEGSPVLHLHVADATIPERPELLQNYPNPFNGPTKIRFGLKEPEMVRLEVVDILGRVVEILVDGLQYAGWHDVEWDAAREASGVYFVQLRTPSLTQVKKLLLAR
jgi:hypothetical protein